MIETSLNLLMLKLNKELTIPKFYMIIRYKSKKKGMPAISGTILCARWVCA
jgi:hypothetical protein